MLEGDVAAKVLAAVLNHARLRQLLSREHCTVDGTLVEAWASLKSFRPKDDRDEPPAGGRNATRDFHGARRTNDGHASTTDPDARLFRKGRGKEARLCFMGHVLMENRHGLVVEAELTRAAGFAERRAAVELVARAGPGPITVGADRAYDAADFVAELRELGAAPHVAQNTAGRRAAIDRRTTRHAGYRQSQQARHRSRRCSPGSRPSPGRARPNTASRAGALALHPGERRLQPDPPAQAVGGGA